jgi:RNA polymerase sigma-70 factor (ECF subfamily)
VPAPYVARDIDALYQREHPRMLRVASRIVRDRHQAAEVVQSAFVRAIDRLATVRDQGRLGAWLARVTTRLALNELRRQRRADARSAPLDDAHFAAAGEPFGDPLVRQRVRHAVDALPESLRLPLLLADVEGYTHVEIARQLGITPGASRTRAARARSILRVQLAALAPTDDIP